jgi:very-short-patch-repair endonuclease
MPDYWEIPEELRRQMVVIAREFRKVPTKGEQLLWQALRGRSLDGVKFRRQQPIGPFVVDFFAAEQRLIVEVDGAVHDGQQEADERRQALLESLGLRFCRIPTELVEHDLMGALALIRGTLRPSALSTKAGEDRQKTSATLAPPLPEVGEGVGG